MIARQSRGLAYAAAPRYNRAMKQHTHPSIRAPRREQALRTQATTEALLARGEIAPAELLSVPEQLTGSDGAIKVAIHAGTSHAAALEQPGRVGVLIFGSANRPGGGWLNGAKAQEEDISLASTWATQAARAPAGFYAHESGLGGLGPDRILVADGRWLDDLHGQPLIDPQGVVFGGIAAPNLANPAIARLPRTQCVDHLARRLAGLLLAWEARRVSCAVLGAIGCGVFQWPGEDSAQALRLALNHYKASGNGSMQTVLAMPDPGLAKIFQETLLQPARARPGRRA